MEFAKSLLKKFKSKEKVKSSKSRDTRGNGKEVSKTPTTMEEVPSNVTKQKVAAAKQYIENHYKKQMKSLQERKERYEFTTSRYSCGVRQSDSLRQRAKVLNTILYNGGV